MKTLSQPSTSIIIELENTNPKSFLVCTKNISRLISWIFFEEQTNIIEVIILYKKKQKKFVETIVQNVDSRFHNLIIFKNISKDKSYYEIKNEGAKISRGDIIVFLDSDLKPFIGTFYELIRPLLNDSVVAVSGSSCFPINNFMSLAYSLFWHFPLSTDKMQAFRKYHLFANSCAFKREWFLKKPFPTNEGGYRVSCYLLSMRIKKEGLFVKYPRVWFYHELWNSSWDYFLWRAWIGGADSDKKFYNLNSFSKFRRVNNALFLLLFDFVRITNKHFQYYKQHKSSIWKAPFTFFVGIFYFMIVRFSQIVSSCQKVNSRKITMPRKFIE